MLNELFVKVGAKVNDFVTGMDKVQNKLAETTAEMQQVGETLSTTLTLPLTIAGGASIKLASDMQESLNKVNVAFGQSAGEVLKWSETSVDSMGMASGSALDAAALFGDMATSMGISQQEAAKMAMSLTALGADLASFKNVPIEQAMQALNGVFTGETESLKMLGVVMTETQLKAFALTQGITKNVDKMSEAELVSLRYAFVLDRTKNAQGDFQRTNEGAANQMRIFTETLKEIGIQIGNVLLPIFTKIITVINKTLKAFANLDENVKTVIVVVAGLVAAIGPVLLAIGAIAPIMATAIATIKSITTAFSLAGAGLALFTNPVGLTVIAIGGLITAGVLLYQNWDTVKQRAEELWIVVSNAFETIWEKGKYFIGLLNPLLFGVISTFKSVYENWDTIKMNMVIGFEYLQKIVENVTNGIKNYVVTNFGGVITMINKVTSSIGQMIDMGLVKVEKAWNNSATKVELAESRKQYAIEQTIKKSIKNAGQTDYMISKDIIYNRVATQVKTITDDLTKSTDKLANSNSKTAKTKNDLATAAENLKKKQEQQRKEFEKSADILGGALLDAISKRRTAEEKGIEELKKQFDVIDKVYQDNIKNLETNLRNEKELIEKNNRDIVESINRRYDDMMDANNDFYNEQINNNSDRITDIENATKREAIDMLETKYKNNVKALMEDKSFLQDRAKLVKALSDLAFEREKKALEENRSVRYEYNEDLTEEENNQIRDRLVAQRDLIVKDLRDKNAILQADKIKKNEEIEYARAEELRKEKEHNANLLKAAEDHFNKMRERETLRYQDEGLALQYQLDILLADYDSFFGKLSDKQIATNLMLNRSSKDMLSILEGYNSDWYLQGQSYSEMLLKGIQSKETEIQKLINSLNSQLGTAKNIESKISKIGTDTTNEVDRLDKKLEKFEAKRKSTGNKIQDFISVGGLAFNNLPNLMTDMAMFANGGIVTKPTLSLVGEGASPEAIIPLNRLGDFIGSNQTHIYLDGREITKSVAPYMVDHLRTKLGVNY